MKYAPGPVFVIESEKIRTFSASMKKPEEIRLFFTKSGGC
jgi:hypothetical protein